MRAEMSGDDKQGIPWLRVFAEGTAILVSILLAFGIEAWWSGRVEAAEEAVFLSGLQTEIDDALEILDFSDSRHQRIVDAYGE